MSDKPREFWVNKESGTVFDAERHGITEEYKSQWLHLIETSAIENMEKNIKEILEKLQFSEQALRFCAGMISGIEGFRDKHPEEVLKWIKNQVVKLNKKQIE